SAVSFDLVVDNAVADQVTSALGPQPMGQHQSSVPANVPSEQPKQADASEPSHEAFQTCLMVDHSLGYVLTSNQIRTPTTTQMTPQSSASSATAQPSRTRSPQPFAA